MDRKKFQNMFSEIDEFLIATLCDDIELCENIDYPVYTKYFFPPQLCKKVSDMSIGNIRFALCGLNENCEKNMIGIYPEEYKDILEFPVRYFKITNKSKFKALEHKDYLGSIMGLGIKRELMGDLIVEEDSCYGIAGEEIYAVIKEKFDIVGRNPVEIEEIDRSSIPQSKFEEINETVSSLRLDNMVSAVANLSRTKGLDLINNGDVSINYVQVRDKSAEIKEGDIITIRKNGKYIFEKQNGESKKGKLRIFVKKFV